MDQANFAHQALHHALTQPPHTDGFGRSDNLGNTVDDSIGLPSTVPESHHIFDASIIESLPPQGSTKIPPRKMNSQSALEATQELSPTYWEVHISKSRSAAVIGDRETQHTVNEGDEGYVDITSSYVQEEADDGQEQDEPRDFSPSQSQRRLSQFPESQRFKTPVHAGKKRDYNGNTKESPELPRAPVLRSGGPTPAHLMGLTQAFDATQAATSPFVNGAINPLSDRPSPNLEVDNRPATATVSSPLLRPISEFKRATTEPATRYISVAQSQEERLRKAQLQVLEADESDDDDFSQEPSLIQRNRRLREREARVKAQFQMISSPTKARPRGSSAIQSSPVLAARRSSPSPTPGSRLSGSRTAPNHDQDHDEEDVEPSEAETEQEEELDVEIRRSSQTSPMDDEDKENYAGHIQIPETTAGLHRTVDTLPSQVEASPSLRHVTRSTRAVMRPGTSSGPVAVANSQPSQPASKSQTFRQNAKSSSTNGIDFVPQSQGNSAQQVASAAATQTPPASPKATRFSRQSLTKARQSQNEAPRGDVQGESPAPEQSSAPAELGNTVPETDSSRIIQSHQPSRSTNSAPGANTLSTSVFETAPTRLPPANSPASKLSELSSPPIVTTPPGRKRKRMSEISQEPSPQQQLTQGFDPVEALHMGSDVQPFLNESPIRPKARQAKRRKVQEPSVEINETVDSASRRLTRATQQNTTAPIQSDAEPLEKPNSPITSPSHPAVDPPNLGVSTRSRKSVWDMDASPQQKRVPTKGIDRQATAPAAAPALEGKTPASTAPLRQELNETTRTSTRAQTQADLPNDIRSQSPSVISKPPPGEIIAPNSVFACFNGKTRAYYPARCLGCTDREPARYRIQWEGYDPDEVDVFGVRSLDLRVGDQVKIDMKGFPKVSYVVRGFTDKLDASDLENFVTDVRGYKTLEVAPKQRKSLPADVSTETVSEIPISAIYLDSNMWNYMKDRNYEFKPPPAASISLSGYATPQEGASTPSTPSSRSRRQAAAQLAAEVIPSTGVFANMAFAISYEDESRKTELVNLIRENGGRLLRESFMELLENDVVVLKSQLTNTGFTALIADKHSRKEKYMQALALGLPCLSGKWLEACNDAGSLVEWQPYLLAAGESEELEGATRSRVMERMDPAQVKLSHILHARSTMLEGAKVVVVMGRGKSEVKRKPYLFLIQALGADSIEKVADIKAAKDLIKSEESFDWVFVEDNNVETAKGELVVKGKKKGAAQCKVAGNELIVQSLIMGKLCES